jgi:poly(A) polymerase
MATLGLRPGPPVGEAYRFLLELRIDRGPVGEEAAREALLEWWAGRMGGESAHSSAGS